LGVSTIHPGDIRSHALQFGGAHVVKKGYLVLFSGGLVGLHLGHLGRA